jgi:hypothetical protein
MQRLWMSIFLVLVRDPTSCSPKPERDNPQLVLPSEQWVKEGPKTRAEPHSGLYGAEHAAHRATLQSIWIVISNDRQCNRRDAASASAGEEALGNHLKAAMSYHLKSGHRETA